METNKASRTIRYHAKSGLFASAAERRSFQYFQSQACKPLGGHFHSSFWGREVLQAAVHYPSIRHLVIALGSAYEVFEVGSSDRETPLTLQQCNLAIRQLASPGLLTSDASSEEVTFCTLTASVLFIYLASIRGRYFEAFQHIRSSAKILQEHDRSTRSHLNAATRAASSAYPVPIPRLRSLLASAYAQFRGMVNDAFLDKGSIDILVSDLKPATVFTSLQEAHAYVERLHQNTLAFLQASEHELEPQSGEALEAAVTRHRELSQALESSQNALDFLAQGLSESGEDDDQESIAILRVYHLLVAIWLRIDIFHPDKRETGYDVWEEHFKEILGLCEFIVRRQQRTKARWGQPSCTSGLGYVMPLHMVAARCRNPDLRWRAVELLLAHPQRETLWDSQLAGKVVAQVIELEEHHVDGMADLPAEDCARVSPEQRVREVKLEFQGEEDSIKAHFVKVEDWKLGRRGLVKRIQL
ncbi:hypothetical protein VTH82DRAFT_1543 [Thermothelomyces myriococcoides]